MNALARQLLVIQAQTEALIDAVAVALELAERDLRAEAQQPEPAQKNAPAALPAKQCRHRNRESLATFGGHNTRRWRCKDCGFEGED